MLTSVVPLLILAGEAYGAWALPPYAFHLLCGQVPSIAALGPVAWSGLFFIFATGVAAFRLVFVMANHEPCHIGIERESWFPYGVAEVDRIVARQGTYASVEPDAV
jgi:hypothetical protein